MLSAIIVPRLMRLFVITMRSRLPPSLISINLIWLLRIEITYIYHRRLNDLGLVGGTFGFTFLMRPTSLSLVGSVVVMHIKKKS